MNNKKIFLSIMVLVILFLLMMSTTIHAADLGKVYNLNAQMNSDKIKLTWSGVSNAKGYNIYVNDTRIGYVYSNSASLIGFTFGTTYRFKVVAFDSQNVEGISSDEIKFTPTYEENIGKVEDLQIIQVNGFVTLNWSSVNRASIYEVFVDVPGYGKFNLGSVTTTNVMLKGFKDGLNYGFGIRAGQVLNNGNIKYGQEPTMVYSKIDFNRNDNKPKQEVITVDQVKNLYVTNITQSSAYISWSNVNNATGYDIYVSEDYSDFKYYGSTSSSKLNYIFSNLKENTYYRVKVVAYRIIEGKEYKGNYSEVKGFTTFKNTTTSNTSNTNTNTNVKTNTNTNSTTKVNNKLVSSQISRVTHLKVEVKNINEAYLSWWPVENAYGYEVYIRKDNGEWKFAQDTWNNNTILYSHNLEYNTGYDVKVRAYEVNKDNEKVYSAYYSDARGFKTGKYTKYQNNVEIGKTNTISHKVIEDTVYLNWVEVKGAEGYEIDLTVPGLAGSTKLRSTTNSINISGITETRYDYTARIRAYKTINGARVYGPYSVEARFHAK